jgi:hypothetical protein
MTRTRLLGLFTAVCLGATLLTGCGGSSGDDLDELSIGDLLDRATTAVRDETYVSITGSIDRSGNETGLDLHYVGDDSDGSITLDGAKLQLRTVDGTTWFKPSDEFWKSQVGGKQAKRLIRLIDGRWIVADPANQSFGQIIQLASRDFVDEQLLDTEDGDLRRGDNEEVDGQKCLTLKTGDGTLYLSADDALPVQITGSTEEGEGKATFSYDEIPAPTAPAKDEQIDLSKLGG